MIYLRSQSLRAMEILPVIITVSTEGKILRVTSQMALCGIGLTEPADIPYSRIYFWATILQLATIVMLL